MTLAAHSPDLARLIDEQYDIEIRNGNLLVHHVPYVNSSGTVDRCILVSELSTDGLRTITPGRHEVWVVGGVPHDHLGNKISIIADENRLDYGEGLVACCRLSGKPGGQMPTDYHHKISNYVDVLGRYARAIDATATHVDAPVRERTAEESVFRYHDAASSRCGLSAVTAKLKLDKVAIVGLGGTGSYILDAIAKTPIQEIHLFDDDVLYAHNAFRTPGAASLNDLVPSPFKVDYYAARYDVMRRNVTPHRVKVTAESVDALAGMSFVFLAMDAGPAKREVIEYLVQQGIPFVDSGIGMHRHDNTLGGTIRVTTGTPARHDHIARRISFADVNADEYDWNIQTVDLNMMNAAMAVVKWKKLLGYYEDSKQEFNSTYTVASNKVLSGEVANAPVEPDAAIH